MACSCFELIRNSIAVEKFKKLIGLGTPVAFINRITTSSIDLEKLEMIVDVLVTNAARVAIPLSKLDFSLYSEGRKLVSGSVPNSRVINPNASLTIPVSVTILYEDIKTAFEDIKPGSVIPYQTRFDLVFHMPVCGKTVVSAEKTDKLPIPVAPDISIEKVEFNKYTFAECVVSMQLKVENGNEFELGVRGLEYEVWLAGVKIASATIEESVSLTKSGIGVIKLPATFRPTEIGVAFWNAIGRTEGDYVVKGSVSVDTMFGSMKLGFSKEGVTAI